MALARADELERVADGYAQLAWAASFVSTRAAEALAEVSNKWAWRSDWERRPMWFRVAVASATTMLLGRAIWSRLQ